MSGDDFELDVHAQRRRVLWQRTYLQALDRLMTPQNYKDGVHLEARTDYECADRSAVLAARAVERFDAWENSQARPAGMPAAGGGGGGPDREEDDPNDQYLGR